MRHAFSVLDLAPDAPAHEVALHVYREARDGRVLVGRRLEGDRLVLTFTRDVALAREVSSCMP